MSESNRSGRRIALALAGAFTAVILLPVVAIAGLSSVNSDQASCTPAQQAVTAIPVANVTTGPTTGLPAVSTTYVVDTSGHPNPSIVGIAWEVAKAKHASEKVTEALFATALTESGFKNYANSNVPSSREIDHDTIGNDHDSVGFLQGRVGIDGSNHWGWGAVAQIMDPVWAASMFVDRAEAKEGSTPGDSADLAQAVQVSGTTNGSNYRSQLAKARTMIAALAGGASPAEVAGSSTKTAPNTNTSGPEVEPAAARSQDDGCGTDSTPTAVPVAAGGAFTGTTADDAASDVCSVRPDPSTGKGCITPRTLALYQQLVQRGWSLSCWDAHLWNPTSDHPKGKACDVFPGTGGKLPTPEQKAKGDALAAQLQTDAQTIGISYIIWYGRIWSPARATEGWRPYNGGGIYNPTDITGGHYDHLHISLK